MKNIALIGFMGTGKTAVGQILAKKLSRRFIEMDSLIEKKAGKTIPEIFEKDGETAFRELEIAVTREIARGGNAVIACGGGVVLNKINTDRLRENGTIVYLTASPAVIWKRVSTGRNRRPLLEVDDPARTIRELLEFRKPFYQRAADITVNTTKLSLNAVARQIIEKMREDESLN